MKTPKKNQSILRILAAQAHAKPITPQPEESHAPQGDFVMVSRQKLHDFSSSLVQLLLHGDPRIPRIGTRTELENAMENVVQGLLDIQVQPEEDQVNKEATFSPVPLEEKKFYISQMRLLADIGTGLWRLRQRMVSPDTDQPMEEMRRAYRFFASVWDTLHDAGVTIQDHTHTPYDPHLALKVLTYEPTPGVTREQVLETIKPSVYYRQRCIQMGEIIVAIPPEESTPQASGDSGQG
jgi:hypothetical protein